ncbi:hypothetical protein DL93DRAFT_2227431 [Clavulina sp. PMI_390]|nr:hypothetical protein DL93DRAFT_2227431 [Clavulina sp. PMI_390]
MDGTYLLPSGERVHINDHVYSAAPWGLRDSTLPYSIGRVMEFLPSRSDVNHRNTSTYDRVRIAWYYRPSDISERSTDSRLLLAAIYSECQPVSYIRGKCYVRHRDMISNLAAWKKQPDCFYFYRFFDPYIKREYEVLLARDVNNVPAQVKATIVQRYQYVVAEKEVVADLIDSLRLCSTCEQWCSPMDAVRCDSCKNFYHMSCVQPPLAAKPAKGYGWSCAPCAKRHEDEVDRQGARSESPPRIIKNRNKSKNVVPPPQSSLRSDLDRETVRYFKMWPFRYFGMYTDVFDTLDPDDLIFPRNPVRVGPKYQATCPPLRSSNAGPLPDVSEGRGEDDSIEVLSSLCHLSETDAKNVEYWKNKLWHKPEQRHLVDFLEEAVRRFSTSLPSEYPNVRMKGVTRSRKWSTQETRYFDREWTDEEARAFDNSIKIHGGAEMRAIQKDVKTRSIGEIVRFYGRWKNDQLKKQRVVDISAIRTSKSSPMLHKSENVKDLDPLDRDDSDSIVDVQTLTVAALNKISCGSCRRKDSRIWWKAPRGLELSTPFLCESCSMTWRKYAEVRSSRPDEPSKRFHERPDLGSQGGVKRIKLDSEDLSVLRLQRTCICCKRVGTDKTILSCQQCGLLVHAAAAGASISVESENWICELCENERTGDFSLDARCLLCPPDLQGDSSADSSYLKVHLPTESQGWVHALCAIFAPEVQFSDSVRMRLVEGLSSIAETRLRAICVLCCKQGGGTIRCTDTGEFVHASCALLAGFAVGFEIQTVRPQKQLILPSVTDQCRILIQPRNKKDASVVTFRGEMGILAPMISRKPRKLYGLCDTDGSGRTILQLYCDHYKQAALDHSYGLLRKSNRMDLLVKSQMTAPSPIKNKPSCFKCGTNYSPLFRPWIENLATTPSAQLKICHQCYTQTGTETLV